MTQSLSQEHMTAAPGSGTGSQLCAQGLAGTAGCSGSPMPIHGAGAQDPDGLARGGLPPPEVLLPPPPTRDPWGNGSVWRVGLPSSPPEVAQLTFLCLRVAFHQQDRGPARLGPRAQELETSPRTGRPRPGLLRRCCAGSRSPGLRSVEAWGRLTQQGGPGQDTGCDSEQSTPESHVHGTSYGGVSSQAPAPRSPPGTRASAPWAGRAGDVGGLVR